MWSLRRVPVFLSAAVFAVACASEEPARSPNGGVGVAPVAGMTGGVIPPGSDPFAQPAPAGTGAPLGVAGSGDSAPTAGAAAPTPVGSLGPIPCDVQTVVANNCHQCHGSTPMGGAISLVTLDDWHRVSPIYDPTKKVYEVAQIRINNGEMPQGAQMAAPDLALLDGWLLGGAVAGTDADLACAPPPVDTTDPTGQPPATGGDTYDIECDRPGARDPLVPRAGENCFGFPVHGISSPTDTSKFTVQPGESYHEWYYDIPWSPGSVATRFGADFDNLQVLHHYLTFASGANKPHGQVDQNVLGTTLGTNSTLISGWAVGGCNQEFPADVGLELPSTGMIMVQWHMYNSTGVPQQDGSIVQMCTVPAGTRPNVAGLTFLGTENFNGPIGMPPGANDFTTTCTNTSGAPITIVNWTPHMHTIGVHMKTDHRRLDGSTVNVFDRPFQFDYQIAYNANPPVVVAANEALITTCSFFNDTPGNVAFGQSTNQEMCYQFVLSYPAGALNNGVPSLIGALNTCW